jgi:23S rRNA pseudouridine1911/1915/1917 synthase
MLIEGLQNEKLITYKVEAADSGITVKELLKKRLSASSRLLTKLKKEQNVLLNGSYSKYHERVSEGDIVRIIMQEEPNQFIPQKIPFEIVYEDIDIIIINKQPGIVSHPTRSHPDNTIANAAVYYLASKGADHRIRFVNRLDMDTSGLLIIAKNSYSHHIISEQMQDNKIQKKYITFVKGVVSEDHGVIDAPIYRQTEDTIKRTVDERGQASVTKFKVLERFRDATKLEVELLTGRTHQIRVHMAFIGHSIIGDTLYGEETNLYNLDRQALHAYYLKLFQPRYRNELEVSAGLPQDLIVLESALR